MNNNPLRNDSFNGWSEGFAVGFAVASPSLE